MQKPAHVLVDSTILYSAVLFNDPERRVLLSGAYVFVTSDFNARELVEVFVRKNIFTAAEAFSLLRDLPVLIVPLREYEHKLEEADVIMGVRDKNDVPLLALALSIPNDGVWSSDKDFEVAVETKVWSTRELLERM